MTYTSGGEGGGGAIKWIYNNYIRKYLLHKKVTCMLEISTISNWDFFCTKNTIFTVVKITKKTKYYTCLLKPFTVHCCVYC